MRKRTLLGLLWIMLLSIDPAGAQPSPSHLSEQLVQRNNAHLSRIDNLIMTTEFLGFTATTRYVKTEEDGLLGLEPVDESESGVEIQTANRDMVEAVRSASSITRDQVDGFAAWKVVIDDAEVLRSLESGHGYEEEISEVKRVTLWLDSGELILRKIYYESLDEDGNPLNLEILMKDYQTWQGLPLAHTMEMKIEGMEFQISEEELEEALRGLAELEEQLSQMPEAQRRMFEEQLRPQMEMFQQMMGGSAEERGRMVIRITDVLVNQN